MRCPQCQADNREGRRFCAKCGGALALACAACGFVNEPGEDFCGGCGTRLAAPAQPVVAPTAAEPRFPSPQTYTPQHLAERIISSRGALEGERKQVTVLFADLKGSMELLADRDPEEARAMLDPVLERMMAAVHQYEGTVNQVMGDGIMALFGAPLAHEDHAVRACYAALRMQQMVQEYAAEVRRATGVLVQIRVGLNSGEVVVRSIGSDLHVDYTAVGQTTHLAARMEQMAAPGSILLSPDTLRLAEGYVEVRALGPMPVKGLGAPVEVYEVVGAGRTRTRLQAAVARGLSRFVGRDAELESLRQSLAHADAGRGQMVAVVGEPGVGKSRLVWEFTHSHRAAGWLVLESGSVSYGKATAYLPVIDLLKAYCGVESQDDARRVREKVAGKVLMLDEALRPSLPALLALLDVALDAEGVGRGAGRIDDAEWQALDPPQRRQRTLDAVKRLLLRESQVQPLLLVFEDLHWIDAETQALLDSLVESLPGARLLLLVNYRPEYVHAWGHKTYYRQLRLDPLPAAGAEELLRALLGDAPPLEPVKRLLVLRTEGNPFFLEETVRMLVERGALVGERGAYQLGEAVANSQVPATVQAILAARIDRLVPEDKRLLQAAAVIGTDVPYALLAAIAELPEDGLRAALGRLQAAEFVYETSLFPDLQYTFKHALTHEVAYASLLGERRRALHARIVSAIERLYPDRQAEQVERLAHHALHGEVWDAAVGYLRQAGARMAARSAYREAESYFSQALDALEHLPQTSQTLEDGIAIHVALGKVMMATLGPASPEVEHHYSRAAELCERAADTPERFHVAYGLWMSQWSQGHLPAARELAEQMARVAEGGRDSALLLEAHHAQWSTLHMLGELSLARAHIEAGLALYDPHEHGNAAARYGVDDAGVCGRQLAAKILWLTGYPEQAMRQMEDALRVARSLAHPYSLAMAFNFIASLHLERGEPSRALDYLEALLALAAEHGLRGWVGQARTLRGRALADQGQYAAGLAEMREGRTVYGGQHHQSYYAALLADAYAHAGEPAQGLAVVVEALARIDAGADRSYEADLYRLQGELLLRQAGAPAEQAEACLRQGLAVARGRGAKSLELRAAMSLSRLWQAQGQPERARGLLAETYGWFSEGLDTADLRQARALLAELA